MIKELIFVILLLKRNVFWTYNTKFRANSANMDAKLSGSRVKWLSTYKCSTYVQFWGICTLFEYFQFLFHYISDPNIVQRTFTPLYDLQITSKI